MNFEDKLLNGIPLDEAAEYFLRLRGKTASPSMEQVHAALQALPPEDRAEILKEAGVDEKMAAMMGPPQLPPTAMGQNMKPAAPMQLPPTAMGDNKTAASKEVREKADQELEKRFHKDKATKGERTVGTAASALGAAAGGAAAHRFGKSPAATAAGILVGYGVGKGVGKDVGKAIDAHRFKKRAQEMKLADGMAPETSPHSPELEQYLHEEMVGREAEEQASSAYYQQRFQQAAQQLQEAQAQAQQTGEMAQQLQMRAAQSDQQVQAAMQQAQMASQSAMSNVQQAHEMAMSATQQAMESQAEVLRQKQLAAAMRMGVQQVKDQVMGALAQDPTEQLAQQLQSPPPPTGGMPGAAPGPQDAAMAQASQDAGQGGPPAPEGPAEGAPDQATQPNSPPPQGEQPAAKSESSGPGSGSTSKGSTQVSIKQGGALPFSVPHALGGAALGALSGAAYAKSGNEGLKKQVSKLEGQKGQGFAGAMNLAQAKARLLLHEAAAAHPLGAAGAAAVAGGMLGATEGPAMTGALQGTGKNIKDIFNALKGG